MPLTARTEMTQSAPPPPPPVHSKLLIDLLIVGVLVVLGLAGYLLAPWLTPHSDVTLPMSTCDLAKTSCVVVLPEGERFEVSITPRPIPALKPLELQVKTDSRKVRKVEIDFAGVDMKMGLNRPRLEDRGNGHFAGQANLPVCVTGGMEWEATVIVEMKGAVIAVPFRFESEGG